MTDTITAPTTPAEWEEYVGGFETPEAFTAAFADGSFQQTINSYVTSQNAVMDDLKAQTREQVQLALHDMFKRNDVDTGTRGQRLDLVNKARQEQTQNYALYNPDNAAAQMNGWTRSAEAVPEPIARERSKSTNTAIPVPIAREKSKSQKMAAAKPAAKKKPAKKPAAKPKKKKR